MGYLIGIDVGTSSVRTLICDERGGIVGAASVEYPIFSPKPGWSEQEPRDWWSATTESVRQAMHETGIKAKQIQGIGLTGQMHGAVFLDKKGEVLRPAILWNDQRTAAECEEIYEKVGRKRVIELTCNPALTGFTAPKILWVRKNQPEIYAKTAKILLPKDYIRYRMSGTYATEVSDASGTLLLEVPKRAWSDEMLQKLSISKDLLPACYESEEVTAEVSQEAAKITGLTPGTPIVGGGGDQAAGGVGNGVVRAGVLSATLGTSGVLFAFADQVQMDPEGRVHTFCHAVRGKWHVMGVMLAAGGSFQWYRNNFAELERQKALRSSKETYEVLCEEAAEVKPGSEGLIFLPYLTGERTPHADPNARGGWIGLNVRHTRAHMVRSLLEGVSYGMRDSLEIVRGMGVPVNEIRMSGGGARSKIWRQMLADVYAHNVCTINVSEGPAFGAALLAAVGTKCFKNIQEACDAAIRVSATTKFSSKTAAVYEKYYAVFRRLYPALKAEFAEVAKLVAAQHAGSAK
jgi:xylulokinase